MYIQTRTYWDVFLKHLHIVFCGLYLFIHLLCLFVFWGEGLSIGLVTYGIIFHLFGV